jgi:hypothetical protein
MFLNPFCIFIDYLWTPITAGEDLWSGIEVSQV